jgi:glycosyltransferase involved in cell wall biosynthesis
MAPPADRKPGLSVFFPAYNDSGTIASLVISALRTARQLTDNFEIIVVNDGSADATAEIADELARTYPQVRVVHHERNRGYGGALRTGFAAATRDLIFYTDGDAQYDPAEMVVLWHAFNEAVDLVNGYKISRSDPLHRIVIGRTYHHAVKLLFGLRVRDVDCDFRLMRRSIFDRVTLEKDSGVICLEMMKKVQDAGIPCSASASFSRS